MRQEWISVCDALPPLKTHIEIQIAYSCVQRFPHIVNAYIWGTSDNYQATNGFRVTIKPKGASHKDLNISMEDIIGWRHLNQKGDQP